MVGRIIIGGPFPGPGGRMVTYIYTLALVRDGGDALVDCFRQWMMEEQWSTNAKSAAAPDGA